MRWNRDCAIFLGPYFFRLEALLRASKPPSDPKAQDFYDFARQGLAPRTKLQAVWSALMSIPEPARHNIIKNFPEHPKRLDFSRSEEAGKRIRWSGFAPERVEDYSEEMRKQGISPPSEGKRKVEEPLGTRGDYKRDSGRNKFLGR